MNANKIAVAGLAAVLSCGLAQAQTETNKRLRAAADMLADIMSAPDKGIPQDLLSEAVCVILVPGLKKGAFIVGGKYGRGFMLCRKEGGVGWSAPAGVRVEGGSFGFQIGGVETDVVMLLRNRGGVEKLLSSKFTLGADGSVAAGPVGRSSSAQTDAKIGAQILTWSRSRGVFAGISLEGATLRPDRDANLDMYKKETSNRDIVLGDTRPSAEAAQLIAQLNKYSSRRG
jgi:SH3 domain-containing YSC84-like protein 1